MAIVTQNIRLQLYNGTSSEWEESDLILRAGEPAYESDTTKLKIGDGRSLYKDLPYISVGEVKLSDFSDEEKKRIVGPKGEKGDPLTYNDLTPDQRLDLKGEPGESVSITDIKADSIARETVITFSDGQTTKIPWGQKGEVGQQGDPGPAGENGSDANVVAGDGLVKIGDTVSISREVIDKIKSIPDFVFLNNEAELPGQRMPNTLYIVLGE